MLAFPVNALYCMYRYTVLLFCLGFFFLSCRMNITIIERIRKAVKVLCNAVEQPLVRHEGLSSPHVHEFLSQEFAGLYKQLYNTMRVLTP